ncbi:MAG: phosphoglycerate dehydrogenase [Acidobacteriota bacterium]|nr:phosphoglycerate dehydrogenase [Acidobacteriota bacterium]
MVSILISDPLDASGVERLRASGAHVHLMTPEEKPRLKEMLPEYDALVVRSGTKVTADVLAEGKKLRVVGRAGIGVDNVDVEAATERGILVVNAPTANMMSATEHTFALLLALARKVPPADASMKSGTWDRKSFVGTELQGKTLGVVGFGRIGQRVARRARAFEMKVLAYDPYLDEAVARREEVEALPLEELLKRSDVVTLHTPLTPQTRNLLNAERLRQMKRGAMLINCGRGGTVDETALLELLEEGYLAGAGLDVYSNEPVTDFTLARHPNVVATPHIGAQTREAQLRIASDTAEMVLKALDGSLAITAVNLPFRSAGTRGELLLGLGQQLGKLGSFLLGGKVQQVKVVFWDIDEKLHHPLGVAALKGVLTPSMAEGVNYVNAEHAAAARGIKLQRVINQRHEEYTHLLGVRVEGPDGSVDIQGTVFGERDARVVYFRGLRLEFRPEGQLLVLRNHDVPGVVGKLGTFLGEAGVNIADIHLAREPGQYAVAALRLDGVVSQELGDNLQAAMPEVLEAKVVDLGTP